MKTFITATTIFFFGITSTAYGFCTWGIVPQGRVFEPLDATEVLVTHDGENQTVVIQPEFRGNSDEFAIIYPTPSKPEVDEAPVNIFWELNNATNPWLPQPILFAAEEDSVTKTTSAESVTVVEEKVVGDYDVTILTATDADDLIEWLDENDYEVQDSDSEKMDYYVAQDGYHFIALKVHIENPDLEDGQGEGQPFGLARPVDDFFFGNLSPLQFTFETDKPQLPMRTLKSSMPTMTFDLYTVGETVWYVPGVDTIYANVIDQKFLGSAPSLNGYNTAGKWLVRQEVIFEPKNSDEDLFLVQAEKFQTVDAQNQKRFDPADLPKDTGILPGTRGVVVSLDGSAYSFTRSLTVGSRGVEVQELQKVLNAYGFAVSESGPGSSGNETMYFGSKTKQALILFQNFYRQDILTPVGLTTGTGYFGPSTRVFLNK